MVLLLLPLLLVDLVVEVEVLLVILVQMEILLQLVHHKEMLVVEDIMAIHMQEEVAVVLVEEDSPGTQMIQIQEDLMVGQEFKF